MAITFGTAADLATSPRLEGKELTKFMGQLNDYLALFDKVAKRIRNEEVVRTFADLFAQEGKEPAKRSDFESPDKLELMRKRLKELEQTTVKPYHVTVNTAPPKQEAGTARRPSGPVSCPT